LRVLGIETSCDETSVAIYDEPAGLLGQLVYSQNALHQPYGGVVPELASRDHILKLLPLTQQLLTERAVNEKSITAIAYTRGPGLIGSLMVGASFAKSLAFAWKIPSIGVHHLESHLMAALLENNTLEFPLVTLLVSGGHTMLLFTEKFGCYQLLGETLDDAAGEAFDKTAKTLGLPYPGGPALAKLATQGKPGRFHFPRPMLHQPNCDFSFSGLKTAAIQLIRAEKDNIQTKADIAFAFEEAIIDVLLKKSERALEQTNCRQLVIAGGVSANQKLREQTQLLEKKGYPVFFPALEFCTDNAAMVAFNGFMHLKQGQQDSLNVDVKARWLITEVRA